MQKGMRLNDGHITYLALLAKKDGTRRGCLSKKSSDNTKWHSKWFALLQNMLFYFENDSSSRPSGLYLLEGCVCDRAPSPKPSLSAKECLEKQVRCETQAPGESRRSHTHTYTLVKLVCVCVYVCVTFTRRRCFFFYVTHRNKCVSKRHSCCFYPLFITQTMSRRCSLDARCCYVMASSPN